MILLDFEKEIINSQKGATLEVSDAAINEKYEKGEARIITEQGAVKLSLVNQVFNSENYELQPKYQRRITWDSKKRSKLIESFIMNIPVPPVFIYETDFNRYQVMDGLQRITAIIDFYKDCYELEELTQWPELNGKKYSQLPRKVKEGIDRRQLSVITLLKESSKTLIQEEEMKKMVFERLNTGGVTLEDQEIRNALYNGPFNELCILLSSNNIFRKLWLINPDDIDVSDEELDNYDDALKYAKNKLYKRMYDVELVLRYFAMPNVTQTLLREHYRCHPKIINFCNQKFYRGELIIMTTDKGEEDVLSVVKTVAGNHERNHYSQRQIDVIKNEIIPKYVSNPEETGIITPYKNQVEVLRKEITYIDAATVHKFQGKEKENIIISTVDDEISDFADDPYLINVAVSRAKKKLMLVVTGNEQSRERNITELIDYIQYNNFEVTESKIYSIFDYLYKQYTEERRVYLQKHKKVSEYDSENLMYSLIEDIISANKYSSLDVVCHFPLNMLIKNPELLNEQECQYAMNPATHLDFLIYNRIGKKPVLAIEVDGYEYHKEDTVQASRDLLKNHIMELYEIPLLRFMTNGSGEKEKIIEMLDKLVG